MSDDAERYMAARTILGPELFKRLRTARILMVGAGGIGCELLKNLVLCGFNDIEIVDLDTIDLSNLNRQFLFQKKHIKKSKAIVARETALLFNPHVKITAHHANIKDKQFNIGYFKSFDVVLNALDNLDARRHVNRMCLAADVPLIESGTTGYVGQVQVIVKDITECYDCQPKPVPRTYPVCTIRSTPSAPIHTIVWAKSYLFQQLFGEDEDGEEELDKAAEDGENADEIASLKKEAAEFKRVRATLSQPGGAERVFDKVFNTDIHRLLSMEDMWKARAKPTPLVYDDILSASAPAPAGAPSTGSGLKDQRVLSLKENVQLFMDSCDRLQKRAALAPGTPLAFDKDDADALDFVTATSNLRSTVYGIPNKSRFDVKEMAGNIIPAIATTNAIIAGAQILQLFHVLRAHWTSCKPVYLTAKGVSTMPPAPPNPSCGVCRDTYIPLPADLSRLTLGALIAGPARAIEAFAGDREISVFEGSRMLADPDLEDNLGKTLLELRVEVNAFVMVVDEDGEYGNVAFVISELPSSHDPSAPPYILPPTPLPSPPKRPAPPSVGLESGLKRPAPENEDAAAPPAKKARTAPAAELKTDASGAVVLSEDEDDCVVEVEVVGDGARAGGEAVVGGREGGVARKEGEAKGGDDSDVEIIG